VAKRRQLALSGKGKIKKNVGRKRVGGWCSLSGTALSVHEKTVATVSGEGKSQRARETGASFTTTLAGSLAARALIVGGGVVNLMQALGNVVGIPTADRKVSQPR